MCGSLGKGHAGHLPTLMWLLTSLQKQTAVLHIFSTLTGTLVDGHHNPYSTDEEAEAHKGHSPWMRGKLKTRPDGICQALPQLNP